jgi:hypothetical protein
MKLLTSILSSLFLTLISCRHEERFVAKSKHNFEIPIVEQVRLIDTLSLFKHDFLDGNKFIFYDKFKFTDTLKLGEFIKRDTSLGNDYIDIYEYEETKEELGKLNSDGFQLFVDYKTNIFVNDKYEHGIYFPAYLVNETSHTKYFWGINNSVFGIQEAIDTSQSDEWRPIESVPFGFNHGTYFGLKVLPEEFLLFLVPKYDGDQKEKMRIRLKVNEIIYLSPPYIGKFNFKQFDLKEGTHAYDGMINFRASTINYDFYGGLPKGYDRPNY